ncbi:hypothetical protein BRC70_08945 [Halobacteriales archaeon QH_6_68_27]|nr:MAG: hypothetical protein BRC70_08945 [Halobacteriales archaeon QH_6_68_27]
MPDGTGLDGRDEPARGADDHAELLSELDSHDLALPMAADEAAPTDVFDGDAFPAPCMPTVYVTKGKRRRKPGRDVRPGDPWYVTLYLEPDVNADRETYDPRAEATAAARDLARRFADGKIDYRDLYQVPREAYFERLDELTGRGEDEGEREE